jgi:hypothetical protein
MNYVNFTAINNCNPSISILQPTMILYLTLLLLFFVTEERSNNLSFQGSISYIYLIHQAFSVVESKKIFRQASYYEDKLTTVLERSSKLS